MMAAIQGCSDDAAKLALDGPKNGAEKNVTYNALSFSWDKVKGAVQYSYQLYKSAAPNNIIVTEVTKDNECSFTGLEASTEYTLKVVAYPTLDGDRTISDPIYIKASTSDIIKLQTPQNLTATQPLSDVEVTWNKVANAESYSYKVINSTDEEVASGSVMSEYVALSDLEPGIYTFSVMAVIDREGYESSDYASVEFEYVNNHVEIWRVEGKYHSGLLDDEWDATLVAYKDQTYSLLGWYGEEGYDLNFGTDDSDPDYAFWISDEYTYDSGSGYYKIPTGRSAAPKNVYVYPWYGYSYIDGDANKGEIGLSVYAGGDYGDDTFTWSPLSEKLAGTWTLTYSGEDYVDESVYGDFSDKTETIKITAVDATTVKMTCPYENNYTVVGAVDASKKSITFQIQDIAPGYDYYQFAGWDYDTDDWGPVVVNIKNDNTLELDEFYLIWGGYYYLWGYGTMTRNK